MALDTVHYVVPRFPGNGAGLFSFVSYIHPASFDAAVQSLVPAGNGGLVIANTTSGLVLCLQWTDAQTMALSVWTPGAQQPVTRVTFFPVGAPNPGAALRYALLLALQTGRAHVALHMRAVQQEQMVYTTRSNGPAGEVVEQQVRATRAMAQWVITPLQVGAGAPNIDDGNAA